MTKRPLSGIRIVDLTRVLAGPLAAQSLGDMGAEVIKVERPGGGDDARTFGAPYLLDADGRPTNNNAFYLSANRNKKSVTVNVADPAGQQIVRDLIATADVFMENYKVGDLARYGLDYDSVKAANPGLIYCSITGYGQDGPYAKRPGYDAIFQGESGLMASTGIPDGQPGAGPMKVGPSISDVLTSLTATSAILGALYERDRNGGTGQHVDVALLDSTISAMSHYAQIYLTGGVSPPRRGTQGNGGMPASMFPTADDPMMVTAGNQVQYVRLCEAVGRPDLITDERFVNNLLRVEYRDELTVVFNEVFRQKPRAHWLEVLDKAGVPSGPINSLEQTFADPQVRHRGLEVKARHGLGTEISLMRNPIRYSRTDLDTYAAPPMLGEHTDHVLKDVLGYDEAKVAELKGGGIV